ncbi:amidohydrolase family protein [Membranihabitans maritimus]|uniref:amidohydrolase family protein n=1 Tax=Membranihabitans maritimus TaxID=2904244 RepID=UPI001F3F517D|nr:amidohydrolase family protein [Membranihabitans maritimus]
MVKINYGVSIVFIFLINNLFLQAQPSILISDVNIIPMNEKDKILSNMDVFIQGENIVAIASHSKRNKGKITIDGSGKYLIPGLSEMHAHIPVPDDGDESLVHETLFLYLSHGITTIRGMLGAPYHLLLREQTDALEFPTPRVYTSSPSLNGSTIPTAIDARDSVIKYKNAGYDFLKIHPGVTREAFDELVNTATEVGIDFAGHVPADIGIEHAIASGYASIDHLDGYVEGLVPQENRGEGGFFGVMLAEQCNEDLINELVKTTREKGIAVVPTQTLMTRWLSPKSPYEMVREPEMALMPPMTRYSWRQNKQRLLDRLNYSPNLYKRFIEIRNKYIKAFQDQGVLITLGSDAPQVFNVPGVSIHHEMKAMADAGLTPYEILKSGTVNVASFFDTPERGTIEIGKVADLVLLAANPLDDIQHASQIESVIYRGQILQKETISKQLEMIKEKYKTE